MVKKVMGSQRAGDEEDALRDLIAKLERDQVSNIRQARWCACQVVHGYGFECRAAVASHPVAPCDCCSL